MGKVENKKTCSAHGELTHDHCISLVPIFNHLTEEQMVEISALTHAVKYKRVRPSIEHRNLPMHSIF